MGGSQRPSIADPPPGVTIHEATQNDNDALIALEREVPLVVGDTHEFFDRSPDYFANQRLHQYYRTVLAEADGRVVGVTAGLVHNPVIQGVAHRLVYIHRGRVHPDFHGRGIGFALSSALFRWSSGLGSEGPYYLISPDNERSIAFGGRAGRRWPVDVTLVSFDLLSAEGERPETLPPGMLEDAAHLINATHSPFDFFEPVSAGLLAARLGRSPQYTPQHVFAVRERGEVVAVAGLCDKGAATERIHVDCATGAASRSREAVVADWGYRSGREDRFASLLRSLAARARAIGRDRLTICEPAPGVVPETGLPARRAAASLFTPASDPPPAERIKGIFFDLLFF